MKVVGDNLQMRIGSSVISLPEHESRDGVGNA